MEEMTFYKTAQFVLASSDLCLASEVDDFKPGADSGTIVSVSGTSTAGSFEIMLMEKDPGSGWGGAASAELDRHNMSLYKVATQRVLDVTQYEFVCRDTTSPRTLWLGVKNGVAATATVDLTLRWTVRPKSAVEVT